MKTINQKQGHWVFFYLMGGIFPLLFFTIGWWGSIGRVPEDKILLVAFACFVWGILLDYLVLKRILSSLFSLPVWVMSLVYLFYSVLIYGFFLGYPVVNPFLAIPAGIYMGIYCQNRPSDQIKKIKSYTLIFTSLVMLTLCVLTLQMMPRLSLSISKPLIYLFLIIGGFLLLFFHYFLLNHYFEKYVISMEHTIQSS